MMICHMKLTYKIIVSTTQVSVFYKQLAGRIQSQDIKLTSVIIGINEFIKLQYGQ